MSIFKTKGIILKVDKINGVKENNNYSQDNKAKSGEFLYTIFTKEYGKIKCNTKLSKKEKTLDLGYLVNFEITTKQHVSIHKIRSIKILSEFNLFDRTFSELNNYLTILSIVNNKTPNGSPIYELFDLLQLINIHEDINELKLLLVKIKISSIFGELNENHKNETITKILKFINANKTDRILKLTGINDELKKELEII